MHFKNRETQNLDTLQKKMYIINVHLYILFILCGKKSNNKEGGEEEKGTRRIRIIEMESIFRKEI